MKVRHILIAVPKGADAKTDAAAKAKAEDLLKQVKAGANFADLAKKYSEDPGSKAQGGELGFLASRDTVPNSTSCLLAGPRADLRPSSRPVRLPHPPDRREADRHTKPLDEVQGPDHGPMLRDKKRRRRLADLCRAARRRSQEERT